MKKRNLSILSVLLLSSTFAWAEGENASLATRSMPPLPAPRMQQSGVPVQANVLAQNSDNAPTSPVDAIPSSETINSDDAQSNDAQTSSNTDDKEQKTQAANNLKARKRAFEQLKQTTLPLTPDQIHELREILDSSQRAAAQPASAPPRPVSSSLVVNLSPGVTPPVIRLAAGYVSSLVFVDSSGSPWPIVSYGLGNPDAFNVQWDMKSNMLMLQSTKAYVAGNLAVKLYGNPTPVMLSIVTGQKEVDYRVDLQVMGRGPYAQAPIMNSDTLPGVSNPELIQILDGIPPAKTRLLNVEGDVSGKAWLKDGTVYYRTKLTLLSPAWNATMSSPDGTKAYALPKTPLLLASKEGQTITIRLTGF